MSKVKHPGAVALGKLGGPARAAKLSRQKLSEIGKSGAAKRWLGHISKAAAKRLRDVAG